MSNAFESSENNLDLVRLLLAIMVIFSHSWYIGRGEILHEPMMDFSGMQTSFGTVAVDLFFIISGFLITNSFLRSRSIWSYLKKRVARIYPGFAACMAVCAVCVVPLAGAQFTHSGIVRRMLFFLVSTIRLREFGYKDAFMANRIHAINGSIWTVSNEFYCYLLVVLLGVIGLLGKRRLVFGLFSASLVILVMMRSMSGAIPMPIAIRQYLMSHIALIPMFLAGMVFFLFRDRIPHKTSWAIVAFCVLIASCKVPNAWHVSLALAGSYLVFWFGFHPRVRLHHGARDGDFSYGVYLYAFPIQELITQKLGSPVNPWLLFAVATPAALIAAILSWHAVEKWFLSPVRRHGKDAPILAVSASIPGE